ncbi:hypothetical protein [uncultured Roseobacter sp.]|uniref:hypothetical protein n=1 Tax=uncultured Roseobacter sp. TaxID=114847 RepID=UPI002637C1E8|nr:hypothetical protein [uncultured Roseobacter sp.]
MARLGILTLHGMGNTEPDYADELFERVRTELGPDLQNSVASQAVYYQDILQQNQSRYFKTVKRRLRWDDLREFMLYGFSDAASLEARKEGPTSPYFLAQTNILAALRTLYARLEGNDRRLIILAHSLGGQVISNYLWDSTRDHLTPNGVWSVDQSFDSPEEEAFCRGRTAVRLLTTGCNIPIFVAGISRDRIEPIPRLNDAFEWHNYYDKDDVLGWPLKDLSDGYAERVTRDHSMNAGLVTGLTPLSHKNYWRDRDFIKPFMKHIKSSL